MMLKLLRSHSRSGTGWLEGHWNFFSHARFDIRAHVIQDCREELKVALVQKSVVSPFVLVFVCANKDG